jgi:TonB-linked SusC/RagA family outer membrane protein
MHLKWVHSVGYGLLLLLFFVQKAQAQTGNAITGTVTDETGLPMTGATVSIKSLHKTVATNRVGEFLFRDVPPGTYQLTISFVGYKPSVTEISATAGASPKVKLILTKDASDLQEVTIAYNRVRKKDLNGAVAQVNMADFDKAQAIKSYDEALAGRVAGVQVASDDGQPGSIANIVIRGGNSVNNSNGPLYVIDGFPSTDGANNSINPADIESITVLKDAASTAPYGSRGANGVILITTKRGRNGGPFVTLDANKGVFLKPKQVAVLKPYDYVAYLLDLAYTVNAPIYLDSGITLNDYKKVQPVNYQDQLFQDGQQQTYNVAMRGGNDNTRYSLSLNDVDQTGVIITSGFKRYDGRFTLDQQVDKRLKVGINVGYAYSNTIGPAISSAFGNASLSYLYSAWAQAPTQAITPSNIGNINQLNQNLGNQLFNPATVNNTYNDQSVNPILNLKNTYAQVPNTQINATSYLEYKIMDDLTFRSQNGFYSTVNEAKNFANAQTYSGGFPGTTTGINGSITYNNTTNWASENMLIYTRTFHNDHHLRLLGDASVQANNLSYQQLSASKIPIDDENLVMNALPFGTVQTINAYSSRWTLASFLGSLNYDYKSRYFLTASLRDDGSSNFAPGNKWGLFPSAGLAWQMGDEDFMKGLKFVSTAKLRLSYGSSGNNNTISTAGNGIYNADFPYAPVLGLTTASNSNGYSYNNSPVTGASLSALGNQNLKWETTSQTDIGYDLGLLKDRVLFTFDYYKKITNNLLLAATLPATAGVSTGYVNIGKMQNTGLEFSVSTTNIRHKSFSWTSSFNISFPENKVLALTSQQTFLPANVNFTGTYNGLSPYIAVVGQPLGQMYGLKWAGVYQYSDFDKLPNGAYILKPNVPDNGGGRSNEQPGDIKYKDINGDGTITAQDNTVIGRGLPIHLGGFSNTFTYKGFDLNVLMQWSYGNDILNANRLLFDGSTQYNPFLNQYATYADRWTPETSSFGEAYHPSNTHFRAGGGGAPQYSSRVVEDGSYLRLKTLALGYSFSPRLLKRFQISSLRVYGSGQNLITWTHYSGPDPEVSVRNSNLTPGFDYAAYPHSRNMVFGLDVNF